MPSCLGIQIENSVIKYAKVQKEKDSIKVEAFNIVFYENLKKTIDRIIEETNSYKIPIVLNLSDEKYDYFQVSALLNKNDIKNAAQIDFDLLCEEKKYNKDTLETRFLFTANPENSDMMRAIAISGNQADLEQKKLNFAGYKVDRISPLSTSITNLVGESDKNSVAVINIDRKTEVTTILKGEIVKVDIIEEGMEDILRKINVTENSIQKSYEVCKNTTIYTQDNGEALSEGNEHIESIMPTLYTIVTKAKGLIEAGMVNVSKIYITGLATAINNIDLYFQEYFSGIKCEILRPFFADTTSIKTSIKDYIEVNSAIALALDGLGYGFKELNFTNGKSTGGGIVFKKSLSSGKNNVSIKEKFKEKLQPIEWMIIRIAFTIFVAIIGYVSLSAVINKQLEEKLTDTKQKIQLSEQEIAKASSDIQTISEKTTEYTEKITELNNLEANQFSAKVIKQSAIPNLLYQLTKITPKLVKINSIENTEGTHIVIKAESEYYEQLGFFNAALSTKGYLLNVKSTSGTKTNQKVNVTIEGDLP